VTYKRKPVPPSGLAYGNPESRGPPSPVQGWPLELVYSGSRKPHHGVVLARGTYTFHTAPGGLQA